MTSSYDARGNAVTQKGLMRDQAIHWLLKQSDGTMKTADWQAFARWLEEDDHNAATFDAVVAADGDLQALNEEQHFAEPELAADAEVPIAANDNPISRIIPWAMAAAAALILAVFVFPPGGGASQFITAPGEMRTLALSDEISVTLNGASEVTITEGEPTIVVERGEVAFTIDAVQPTQLRVEAAGLILTDYGTIFNVSLDDETLTVSVAEGIVVVNPDGESLQVQAGEAIDKSIGSATLTYRDIEAGTVGAWREGRLEFDDTPLAAALLQIERSAGLNIEFDPRLAQARLTGSILIPEGPGAEAVFVSTIATFVGGNARQAQGGWIIE